MKRFFSKQLKQVCIVGGTGRIGSIHLNNLKSLNIKTINISLNKSKEADININPGKDQYKELQKLGCKDLVIAVNDDQTVNILKNWLDQNIKRIFLEKPGAKSYSELFKISKLSNKKGIQIYMGYQRLQDEKLNKFINNLQKACNNGYNIESLTIYSADKQTKPDPNPQIINQGVHDINLLISIMNKINGKILTVQSQGLPFEGTKDQRLSKTFGKFENQNQQKGLYEIEITRNNEDGTYTKISVSLTKYNSKTGLYDQKNMVYRNPVNLEPDNTWAESWKDSYQKEIQKFANYDKDQLATIDHGLKVLRFGEIALVSLNNNGKKMTNIQLLPTDNEGWLTLGCEAGINESTLYGALNECKDKKYVIGVSELISGNYSMTDKTKQNLNNPLVEYKNLDEIKENLNADGNYGFYLPFLPSQKRLDSIKEILSHFKSSLVLVEKPVTNTISQIRQYYEEMKQKEEDYKRIFVGYHDSYHPTRKMLLDLIKKDTLENGAKKMVMYHFYPQLTTTWRIYDQPYGGVMKDMGVYNLQLIISLSEVLGFDYMDFKLIKKQFKFTNSGLDVKYHFILQYNIKDQDGKDSVFEIENHISNNPGDSLIEYVRFYNNKGKTISQNNWLHQHLANGIYLDGEDGKPQLVENSIVKKMSYTYQMEYVNEVIEKIKNNQEYTIPKQNTLKRSLEVCEFLQRIDQAAGVKSPSSDELQ